MAQGVLETGPLPHEALAAARAFHAEQLPKVTSALAGEIDNLAIVMKCPAYDHADWRRAIARDLAREYAPKRVNIVAGDAADEIEATLAFLDAAPGVTGHYLPLQSGGGARV
ncbi:Rossmann fold domain-containing protein [Parerythrobacter jejuensis]|uniref:Short chain dehydrogenase-like proteobacteria domain-containing protein n=1 Tax=Parerythrobacter jejuensis TaxID=795812 RepID=A0A845ASM3_9SPHN|nr:hypothetical protein [Parerythrobacter jejuensis]MXP31841.1 hypothetical protein [Parerythrobacter jejuensis]